MYQYSSLLNILTSGDYSSAVGLRSNSPICN